MNSIKKIILLCLFSYAQISYSFELAITVDDLPMGGKTLDGKHDRVIANKVISTLKEFQVPEVYGFVVGSLTENMLERQKILEDWTDAGFLIGNHSYSHLKLSENKKEVYLSDLRRNESILIDYAKSISELKVYRYPYLNEGESIDKRYFIRSQLSKRKYRIAQVTMDFTDWEFAAPYVRCTAKNKTDSFK